MCPLRKPISPQLFMYFELSLIYDNQWNLHRCHKHFNWSRPMPNKTVMHFKIKHDFVKKVEAEGNRYKSA